jgi:hypothetical protein
VISYLFHAQPLSTFPSAQTCHFLLPSHYPFLLLPHHHFLSHSHHAQEFKNCANEEAVAHWKVTKREKAGHSSHATHEKPVRSTTPTPKRKRPPSKQVTLRRPAGSERRDLTNASSMTLGDSTRQESENPEEKMWKVKDILKETRSDYLIAWESDPDTGKQYEPTWVSYYDTRPTLLLMASLERVKITFRSLAHICDRNPKSLPTLKQSLIGKRRRRRKPKRYGRANCKFRKG